MGKPAVRDRLTVDAFIDWAMAQPGGRYELLDGEVLAMSPERVGHARIKARVWWALDRATAASGSSCEALPDGLSVPIDESTSFEPDAMVRCGAPLDDHAVKIEDPLIVVEVISPGSRGIDTGIKLQGYFSLPSLEHYLVIDPQRRAIIHYARDKDGSVRASIHRAGSLALDPPGIALPVEACFPEPDPA